MEPRRVPEKSTFKIIIVTILGAHLLIFNSQNVDAKYVPASSGEVTEHPPHNHLFVLDKQWNPEEEWPIKFDSSPTKFEVSKNSSEFRIAVHLKECDFNNDLRIEIWMKSKKEPIVWDCPSRRDIPFVDSDEEHFESLELHRGTRSWNALKVVEDLDAVVITPNFVANRYHKNESDHNGTLSEARFYSHRRATLVISIYKDINQSNGCGPQYYNCYKEACPTRCCSEHSQQGTSSKSSDSFLKYLSSETGKSRCIPISLKCNENPNCGSVGHNDERDETCPSVDCGGCQMCLSWDYVLTSLAIAVLFIITPTAIVFALFHRRNVALERQRLIRLAQARMADLRGEFTRESPINDLPPTYDEVCDIKVPPPCFCQAIAMEMGMDAMEFQQIMQDRNNSNDFCGDNSGGTEMEMTARRNNDEIVVDSSNDVGVGAQNLGFKCSCQSIDQNKSQNSPPSYDVLNTTTAGTDSDHNQEIINGSPEVIDEEGQADDKSTNL